MSSSIRVRALPLGRTLELRHLSQVSILILIEIVLTLYALFFRHGRERHRR